MKKKIKINFTDVVSTFNKEDNEFINALRERYDVEISDNPDYIIYSVFGNDHLRYDCVRIFYSVECFVPNFNQCDYAYSFDRIDFGDRYRRIPNYLTMQWKQAYIDVLNRKPLTMDEFKEKKKEFCTFVVSNCFADDLRAVMFDKLSEYKKVDSGGRYKNNIGGAVKDKKAFLESHKFNIAFENCSAKGYTTEKIVDAFQAYTIPIYFGDPDVVLDFNEDAFVNVNAYDSLEEAIERIKEIDENDELALKMLNTDPLKVRYSTEPIKDFLYYIFDQDLKDAPRRYQSMYTKAESERILRHDFYESKIHKYIKKAGNTIKRIKTGTALTSKRTK